MTVSYQFASRQKRSGILQSRNVFLHALVSESTLDDIPQADGKDLECADCMPKMKQMILN